MSTETTPTKVPTIEVCHGPQCSDYGGRALSEELNALGMKAVAGDCRSQCPHAPVVLVDNRLIPRATLERVIEQLQACRTNNDR